MTRKAVMAANWKMHGTRAFCSDLAAAIAKGVDVDTGVDVIVCPPSPYLLPVADALEASVCSLGAQDVSEVVGSGAHTGDTSGAMLLDCGARFVIVGHSERRATRGEGNDVVARKFAACHEAGLSPILCVGETLDEREAGETENVLSRQLSAVIDHVGIEAFSHAIVAYEPVWAIGTGRSASPEQAQAAHAHLRATLAAADAIIAGATRIVYGGSVKPESAAALMALPDVDGGLVGGASLVADDFLAIIRAASRS